MTVANGSTPTKSEAERQQAEMQSQIITVSKQNTNSSGVAKGGRFNEPFVNHKLIAGKGEISCDADFAIIGAWMEELYTDLGIIMPGAKVITNEPKNKKQIIDEPALLCPSNSAMVTDISRELYMILSKKAISQSRRRI